MADTLVNAFDVVERMLAERAAMGTDQAFACLRSFARTTRRRLADVAGEVVSGALSADLVLSTHDAGTNRCRKAEKPDRM